MYQHNKENLSFFNNNNVSQSTQKCLPPKPDRFGENDHCNNSYFNLQPPLELDQSNQNERATCDRPELNPPEAEVRRTSKMSQSQSAAGIKQIENIYAINGGKDDPCRCLVYKLSAQGESSQSTGELQKRLHASQINIQKLEQQINDKNSYINDFQQQINQYQI